MSDFVSGDILIVAGGMRKAAGVQAVASTLWRMEARSDVKCPAQGSPPQESTV